MKRLGALFAALSVCAAVLPLRAQQELGPRVLHMPVLERRAEQGILTPVPINVDLPRELALSVGRVLVYYRVWGDPDWTALELRRGGTRWSGAIPCLEVSTITGDVRYYIRVHDVDGKVVASSGSRAKPYRVTIKHDTVLGAKATKKGRCPDPSDCPRGLPGCPSEKAKEIPCSSDRDCEGGMTCSWRGYCESAERGLDWLSLGLEQDLGFVATSNACSVPSQENEGWACYRESDGDPYIGYPVSTNEPVRPGWGPTRVVLGYDRVVFYNSSLGVRAGFAFAGEGPTVRGGSPFVPWSVALRATHWFGDDPFAHSGLRPSVFMTAGYGMFDLHTKVDVREDPTKNAYQSGNDLEQTVDGYKRAGDGFAGLGAGLAFAFTPKLSVGGELSVLQAFPFSATIVSASVGPAVAF